MTAAAHAPRVAPDLAELNRRWNATHAMADLRARGGRIVRAIEERRRRGVAQRVLRHRPEVVVDVGCEDGWIAEAYVGPPTSSVRRLVLADLDVARLARAPVAADPRVEVVEADATRPAALIAAVGEGRADVVVLSALLEHLPEPGAALRALAPLLAPPGRGGGGRFVVYLPADAPILAAKRILEVTRTGGVVRGLSLEPAPGHLHRFDRAAVRRLLAPHGILEEVAFDPAVLGYHAVLRRA
jgi:SAM-dependent methyltransferase